MSEAEKDCIRFGIDPALLVRSAYEEKPKGLFIWPDMVDSVALFMAMQTQWRWVGAGMGGVWRTGLDYSVLNDVATPLQIKVTSAALNDIRTLESAALAHWSRKHR